MKIRKEHIVAIVVVALLAGGGVAVYQFYYKQELAAYALNLRRLDDLEKTLSRLQATFSGYKPDVLVAANRGGIQPLADEVVQRSTFFNTSDWLQIDPIPQGKMLKFYYEEQFNKTFSDLRQYAMSRTPPCAYPDATTFGAPKPEEFVNRDVTATQVEGALRHIRFACSTIRLLMEAKAVAITQVEIWEPRPGYAGMLSLRTTGLSFVMYLKDLTAFLESLRTHERYFCVNTISIQNRYMRWPVEPPVEVKMLLTQAEFIPGAPGPGAPQLSNAGGAPQAGQAGGMSPAKALEQANISRKPGQAPDTMWQKTKLWLQNHFLWPRSKGVASPKAGVK